MGHISLMLIVFSAFSSILPEPKLSLCSSRHYLNQLHVLLITSGYKTCATGWMTLVTASQCIRKPFFEDTGKRNIAQVKKKIAFVTCLSVIPTWSYFHFLNAFSNISPEPKLNICSSRYCISLLLLVLKHTTVCNIHVTSTLHFVMLRTVIWTLHKMWKITLNYCNYTVHFWISYLLNLLTKFQHVDVCIQGKYLLNMGIVQKEINLVNFQSHTCSKWALSYTSLYLQNFNLFSIRILLSIFSIDN